MLPYNFWVINHRNREYFGLKRTLNPIQFHPFPQSQAAPALDIPGIWEQPQGIFWEFCAIPSQAGIFPCFLHFFPFFFFLFPSADPITSFLCAGNSHCSLHWQLWIHKFLRIIQGNATSVDFIPDPNPPFYFFHGDMGKIGKVTQGKKIPKIFL